MGLQTDIDLLRARFETSWKALHPTIHYILDNDPEYTPTASETFAVFSVRPNTILSASFNYQMVEQTGTITIKVCVPAETGVVSLWPLADDALSIFKHWRSADNSLLVTAFSGRVVQATDTDPYCQYILVGEYQSTRGS